MKLRARLLIAVMSLSLIAAACGDDDSVDQDAVNEILDDGGDDAGDDGGGDDSADGSTDDSTDDSTDGADDSTDGADDSTETGDDTADDSTDDGGEPEPVVATPTDHCTILRHYQNTGVFEAPYFVTVSTDIDLTEDDEVTVVMPNDEEFTLDVWPTDDTTIGRIDVNFPVWGPGEVLLPEVWVNGEQLDLSTMYWGGANSFVAAGADIRDEEIYGAALPCTLSYMVMIDPSSLGGG